jgi:hypothetical protein
MPLPGGGRRTAIRHLPGEFGPERLPEASRNGPWGSSPACTIAGRPISGPWGRR